MNKDEVLKLAKEQGAYVWKENIEVEAAAISYYSAGDSMFTDRQLLAFANACEKIGMEKAAIEAELLGKKIGRKYALIEAGNIAWDCGEKALSKRLNVMANEIPEI